MSERGHDDEPVPTPSQAEGERDDADRPDGSPDRGATPSQAEGEREPADEASREQPVNPSPSQEADHDKGKEVRH